RTPPAALISLTASFAPFAAGRSSADSSPVRANPPPILIVPTGPPPPVVGEAAVLHAARTRTRTVVNARTLRVMAPPPDRRGPSLGASLPRCRAGGAIERVRALDAGK